MDKIQIKGLKQGTRQLKDGSFPVGFKTLYGTVWITMETFPRFFAQNPQLEKLFKPYIGVVNEEEFIGRYINVRDKRTPLEYDRILLFSPRL